jgi:hypothetical protein
MEIPACLRHITRSLGFVSRGVLEGVAGELTDDGGTWWVCALDEALITRGVISRVCV